LGHLPLISGLHAITAHAWTRHHSIDQNFSYIYIQPSNCGGGETYREKNNRMHLKTQAFKKKSTKCIYLYVRIMSGKHLKHLKIVSKFQISIY